MGADRREPLGATRDGPIQTRQLRRQRRGASPQKPRMHAGEFGPRRFPAPPERASREPGREDSRRPPWALPPPAAGAALRRARPESMVGHAATQD